jgi:small-conductance mechanosensitive channel
LNFLPSIIAAVIIFLLGGIVATFVGNLVAAVAGGSGLSYAARLGQITRVLVSLFVVVLALSALKVDTALLVTAITISIAAFGLAIGLALGLGARGVVHHVLAGYYLRQRFPVGQVVALDAARGAVSGIGGVNTLLTTQDGEGLVIPNAMLLESLVRVSTATPTNSPPAEPDQPAP